MCNPNIFSGRSRENRVKLRVKDDRKVDDINGVLRMIKCKPK